MLATRSSTILRSAAALLALSVSVRAAPAGGVQLRDAVSIFDDVLVFDAPARADLAQVQVYTFIRQDMIPDGIINTFASLFAGIDLGSVGDAVNNIGGRLKLFVSIPRSAKEVELSIPGCANAKLRPTSSEIDGISVTDVKCTTALASTAPVVAKAQFGSRSQTANVFPSSPNGFGVISDVDDTIKVSHVLDKVDLVKKTFIEDPVPVAGMPQLYASLKTKLSDPLFSYVSGSPFQLQPFISGFVAANYPDGPKYLRNLTVFDIPRLIDTLTDENNTFTHKINSISRLVSLYPAKKFMMIGDSTEKDPEIYAQAFKQWPNSVQCIWIRAVDEANNSQARFDAAFAGVPAAKRRVFTDAEIASLSKIDVAKGAC